jgi:hypothetical protein
MAEVTRSATASARGIDNSVPLSLRYNIGRMAEHMECVRALLGGEPIKVNSWYRCPTLNTAVGGSETSVHPKALAVDWRHSTLDLEEAFDRVNASALPFDQLIIEGTADGAQWIHLGLSEGIPRRGAMRAHGAQLGGPMTFTRVAEG